MQCPVLTPRGRRRWARPFETFIQYEPMSGCHVWIGARTDKGYGTWWNGTKSILAHHVVTGPIQVGMTRDHLCRLRCCVNPSHLEVVSMKENQRRGNAG